MGCILIGAVIAGVLFYLATRHRYHIFEPLVVIGVCVLVIGLVLGLAANLTFSYCPPREIYTVKLHNLADQTASRGHGSMLYVAVSPKNSYTYYTDIESEFKTEDSKAYTSYTISESYDTRVTIIEEKNCTNPHLTKYHYDSAATFWSFGLADEKISYVFYVPEGTIAHEYALGQ